MGEVKAFKMYIYFVLRIAVLQYVLTYMLSFFTARLFDGLDLQGGSGRCYNDRTSAAPPHGTMDPE